METKGTYIDAKTGKRSSVSSNPVSRILRKPIFVFLLVIPSLGVAQQLDMRVRAVQSGAYSVSPGTGLWVVPTGDFGNITIVYE